VTVEKGEPSSKAHKSKRWNWLVIRVVLATGVTVRRCLLATVGVFSLVMLTVLMYSLLLSHSKVSDHRCCRARDVAHDTASRTLIDADR
jgi:hypothetical protein